MGYEAIREQTLARQKETGHRAAGHRAAAAQPDRHAADQDRAGRQAVPGGGLHPAVGLALRRREAPVPPDGRGVRGLPRPRRPPDRAAAGLPGGDRPAGKHPGHPGLRQRRQRGGRPERLGQRERSSSTGSPTTSPEPRDASTSSAARRPTTITRPGGRWPSTPRSRCGSGTSSTAARPTRASSPGRRALGHAGRSAHQYHHAIDIVPTILDCLGVDAPGTIKGHTQSKFDGVSMRYSLEDAKPRPPGRRSSTRCSAPAPSGMKAGRR